MLPIKEISFELSFPPSTHVIQLNHLKTPVFRIYLCIFMLEVKDKYSTSIFLDNYYKPDSSRHVYIHMWVQIVFR